MSFTNNVMVIRERSTSGDAPRSKHDFWVYTNPLSGYTAHTQNEKLAMGTGGELLRWTNPRGEIQSFAGLLDVSGNVVLRLPVQPHFPDTLLRIFVRGDMAPSGTTTFLVGRAVEDAVDEGLEFGDIREVLIWRAPNRMERIATPPQVLESAEGTQFLKAHGVIQ